MELGWAMVHFCNALLFLIQGILQYANCYAIFDIGKTKRVMGAEELQELIFIYNADSGLKNVILDGAHKVLSPATYDCTLCQLTHGAFQEKKIWRNFRERHTMPMRFLHKDEFIKEYASKFGYKFSYPLVLGATHEGLEVVISKEELNALSETEALIRLLEGRM